MNWYQHIQKRECARVRTLNMIESMHQSSTNRVSSALVIECDTMPDIAVTQRGGKYVVVITEGGGK